jgi:hypothetical protein
LHQLPGLEVTELSTLPVFRVQMDPASTHSRLRQILRHPNLELTTVPLTITYNRVKRGAALT